MVRRRFTRSAGYSGLEVKCLALFGVFLALVLTASFILYWYVTESLVAKRNPDTARLLADQAILLNHWQKLEPKEEFLWVVDDLTKQLAQQKYEWESIPPDTPEAEQDEIVQKILAEYHQEPQKVLTPYGQSEGDVYHYYKPVTAEEACLTMCHNQLALAEEANMESGTSRHRYKEGDLMTILKVSIPNGPTQRAINWSWNMLLTVMFITAFMGMLAFYVTIRYIIIRPLRHLREISSAIGHGNMELRADLHTGDEFESLAISFNRMLRGLINSQRELSRANQILDGKIGELGQANLQLKELNRIKNDFLATMSHELRTPLNSILGFSDVLGAISTLDEKQRRYVQNIQKSGRMLLSMINDILDLAKIESGRMETKLGFFSITHVVGAQCDMAKPLAEKKNINLTYEVPPNLPNVCLDQNRVQQILNNLISNAIKFTPEGGVVKVIVKAQGIREFHPDMNLPVNSEPGTVQTQDLSERRREFLSAALPCPENLSEKKETPAYDVSSAKIILQVTDTGVGIAEEDLQTIFEKFRQGKSALGGGDTMTREYSGTGLGLSIVKELSKLMKGSVHVESTLGVGSTFTVELPWKLEASRKTDDFTVLMEFDDFVRSRKNRNTGM
ncbi:MAG: ATP-binding protein [Planctomycetia bacterium]|nr:ATP-binding protein [Planctomycetia bacterium]